MSRKDYEIIKKNFEDYIKTWNTKDKRTIDRIVDKFVLFSTSTSKRMANGAQNSVFGVYDFLDDFPQTDVLHTRIYNYVTRICGNKAFGYAEVVCTGFKTEETLKSIDFTVFVQTIWTKEENWMITSLRHEAVYEKGDLKEAFEEKWHFEDKVGGRIQVVRGEADSPWLNIPDDESELTETEQVKDCIIKNTYGEEHIVFTHCFETFSKDYNAYTFIPGKDERMKAVIHENKASRMMFRYLVKPFKFRSITFEGDRAFVELDRVRGKQRDTGSNHSSDGNVSLEERANAASEYEIYYPYTEENMNIEHTVARGHYELVKEDGQWKVAYCKLYPGIYECGNYEDSLFGDEC